MVRKTTVEYAENPSGGTGSLEKYHIVSAEELNGHGKMFAKSFFIHTVLSDGTST